MGRFACVRAVRCGAPTSTGTALACPGSRVTAGAARGGTWAHRVSGGPAASLRSLSRLRGALVDHILGFLSPRVDAIEPVALRADTDVHFRQSVAGSLARILD